MGAIIKTQKNAKLTPQTIPCRISEQPQNKFGCSLFGELRGWDTRALPTNLQMVDNFSYPKKIPGSKISILKKPFDHPRHLKSGVPALEACMQRLPAGYQILVSLGKVD